MKVMTWDIETMPLKAFVWGLWDQTVSIDNIIEDYSLICASWKWLGKSKVHHASILDDAKALAKNPYDDAVVIRALHAALMEADVLVGHNADKFDLKRFNTRASKLGLSRVPKKPSIDTLKVAKTHFAFTSNKLAFISKFYGFEGKGDISMADWRDATTGCPKAIRKMIRYNKRDVKINEEVYLKLRPYMDNHPNFNTFHGTRSNCPKCGHAESIIRGYANTRTGRFARMQCKGCGGYHTDPKNLAAKGVVR